MAGRRTPAPAKPRSAPTAAEPVSVRPLWLALAILALGVWAYSNSLAGVFVLDDVRAIVHNPTIRTLSPLSTPLSPPTASTVAGRPVANLSFAINYALSPSDAREDFDPLPSPRDPQQPERFLRNARGYHLGNLAIHLATALLLFGIVRRTLLTPRLRPSWGEAASWVAACVAALWVAHPLPTAAVTYLVQRVESLMGLFYLLTLYCAIRADGSRRAWAWSAAAVTACSLGMGTKETMVTAPLAVAAWDHVFGERRWTRPRLALLGALAATWVITVLLLTGEQRAPSVSLAGDVVWRYLLTQSAVIVHYLRLVFVPTPLAALYDWPLATSIADVAIPLVVVCALLAAAVVAFVRRSPASFAGALFFLFLAPSSSVLPIVTEVAAEHRMYVPLACVVALVVIAIVAITRRFLPVNRGVAVAGVVLVLGASVGLGAVTRARNADYASEERLWQSAVEARPSDSRTRVAYGSALASAGRFADAETQLSTAVDLSPTDPVARVRLGSILARQNKLDAAGAQLERALELRPDDIDGLRFLAEVRAIQRRDADAVALYERILRLMPNNVDSALRLAAVLADSRDTAVRNGPRATALAVQAAQATRRQDVRALEVLAVALGSSGRFAEAATTAREAAALARSRGESRRADALEYRAVAYDYAAQQGFVPQR